MEQVKNILEGSLLWRALTALCIWCGGQWNDSAVIQWFLHPARWARRASQSSLICRLGALVRRALCWIYEKLRLDKLFAGSVFLNPWFWCTAAVALAALVPTMAALGLAALAYCSLILVLVRRREQSLCYAPMNRYLMLFIGVYVAAIAMSVTPSGSLKPGLMYIAFAGFALVVENSLTDRRQLEFFTGALVLAAAAVSVIGILQYIFGVSGAASWVDQDMFGAVTRVYATLQNPNVLAEYLVLVLPIGGALLLTAKTWGKRILWFICCGLITLGLLLTFSRGGWLGALIAGAIFVLLLKPKLILLAPVALAVLWFVLPDTITARFSSIGNLKDSSTSYRVAIWMGTIAMLKDYWLCGIGPGTDAFNLVYPAYCYSAANAHHSHNLLLQLVSDGGICALVLFLVMIFAFARYACIALHRNRNWRTHIFPVAVLAGVMGFLAQGMTDFSFYNYRVTLVFWAVLGLGTAWSRQAIEEAAE